MLAKPPSDISAERNGVAVHLSIREPSIRTFDEDSPWAKKMILSLDGGGVRGLSSLLVLQELMKKIQQYEEEEEPFVRSSASSPLIPAESTPQDETGSKRTRSFLPCHYFDYIGGTSTGGLMAIMLGRLRMDMDSALNVYRQLATEVFERSSSRLKRFFTAQDKEERARALQKVIDNIRPTQSSVGEKDTDFKSDNSRCKTVVCALRSESKNDITQTPYLFRSYDHPTRSTQPFERNPGEDQSFLIRDVARAASAAPIYFKPVQLANGRFFDASIVLNNPSWEIFKEVNQMHGDSHYAIDVLLSIGCGQHRARQPAKQGGVKRWNTLVPYTSMARHKFHLGDIIDSMEERMLKASQDLNYYRFCADLDPHSVKSDEWREHTASLIAVTTKKYLGTQPVDDDLSECAKGLVARRRARAQTMKWESFALGTRYRCPVKDCEYAKNGSKMPFENQNELLDHLQIEHEVPPPNSTNYEEIQRLLNAGRTNSY
ncbi:hypothetical protein MMC30_008084 [Trapelia coarctata]|nr:hypothetical protein [Trapelia coarctata]